MRPGRPERSTDLIYGIHAVYEAMRAEKRKVRSVTVVRDHRSSRIEELLGLAGQRGIPVSITSGSDMSRRFPGREDQGVTASVDPYPYGELEDVLRSHDRPRMLLALDEVQDPQNLGAVIRGSVAFGVGGLILPRNRSALVTPAVVRASAGMTEHITVAVVSNLATAMRRIKDRGVWVFGLDGRADRSLYMEDLTQDFMFVMGSEGKGLRRLTAELCDRLLKIPMSHSCESLNVSAASAVALAEAARQRHASSQEA